MFAEQFDVPSDYELLNPYVWTGELGKIGGGVVDIFVVDSNVDGSGEVAAARLCAARSRGAVVERTVAEVPADWESCSFESMEQRVLVGTYARFKGYRESLADDACGANRCVKDSLVVWID